MKNIKNLVSLFNLMALENITNTVWNFPPELIGQVILLINFLQALGGVIIIYIIFNIIHAIINRKRNKKLDSLLLGVNNMNRNLEEIKRILYRK